MWDVAAMERTTTLLTNLSSRRAAGQTRSLDGTWRAIIDPYDSGYIDIMGERNKRGYYRDFAPRHPADRVEYDFDTSLELEVPGDWNTQHPELHYYEGTVWYRRTFECDADEPEGTRSFLSFGAANHTTRVFLDGEELARHEGGFGPFAVEATGRLASGHHSLVVMVNNRREPDRIPAMRTDWWNFGGITRSVEIITVPTNFLRDAWLTMNADGSVHGGLTTDAPSGPNLQAEEAGLAGMSIRIELSSESGEAREELTVPVLGTAPQYGQLLTTAAADAFARWQPGAPVLHNVSFSLLSPNGDEVDRIDDQVGLRTVRVDGTQIFVNDEPVFLHGIALHGEGPTGGKRAHGDADAKELLQWAVDLGANFVRLSHYQHDEAMVRETDRLGLLAWGELPVYWGIDFGNANVLANGLAQTEELIVRDRSRASLILWSVANETLPGPEREAFLTGLISRVRELDPTRLVTAALLTIPSNDPEVHVTDPLGEFVDVIGINQYLGWYYGDRASIRETNWSSDFNKPIVFTELGAGAKFGNHGDENEIWTEEFQAAVYREQIAMIERQMSADGGHVAGLSPWILKDFRTPMRVLPGIQDGYNRKGLVSEEGERKLAFDVLRDWYQSLSD